MVPSEALFSDRSGGYIYRRYQRTDDPSMDNGRKLFPLSCGHRTEDARRGLMLIAKTAAVIILQPEQFDSKPGMDSNKSCLKTKVFPASRFRSELWKQCY
jgi:hypothetical protein